MKNVQIPYELFVTLLQYHLAMEDGYVEDIRRNRTGVERDCRRQQSPRQGAKPVENA